MDQNTWIGVGRLVKDPEFVPAGKSGDPHIKFTLVVNRVVPRGSGPKADYFPCIYWGADAQALVEQMGRGNEVGIEGRIYTDMVEKGNGHREFFWEVRVDTLHMGRPSLKNLGAPATVSHESQAIDKLHKEFA